MARNREWQEPDGYTVSTDDAHDLYRRFGFQAAGRPEIHMFIERSPAELWAAEG